MKVRLYLLIPAVAVVLGTEASAGVVTMKNGDRLTGTVVKSDGKGLTLQSEFAGTVTIQWDAVVALSSEAPLHLVLKDDQKLVGRVDSKEGRVEIRTEDAGVVTVAKTAIQAIRSQAEEKVYQAEVERLRNPGLLDLWSGHVDAGFATTRGNTDTSTFNLGMNAARTGSRDKLAVHLTSIRARSDTRGISQTTANATRGGLKYNLKTSEKTSVFGFTDLEFDEFQSLDLRFVTGGGVDYHMVKTENTTFDLSAGGSFNKEFFSTGLSRSSGEVLLGEELSRKLFGVTTLEEKLIIYPNVTERGAFRVNFDISAVTKLSQWVSWQFTVSDRYLSNPVLGNRKNDILLTTGVRVTFEK